jgi:hypothetical protein
LVGQLVSRRLLPVLTCGILSLISGSSLRHRYLNSVVRADRRLLRLGPEGHAPEHAHHRGCQCETDEDQFHRLRI